MLGRQRSTTKVMGSKTVTKRNHCEHRAKKEDEQEDDGEQFVRVTSPGPVSMMLQLSRLFRKDKWTEQLSESMLDPKDPAECLIRRVSGRKLAGLNGNDTTTLDLTSVTEKPMTKRMMNYASDQSLRCYFAELVLLNDSIWDIIDSFLKEPPIEQGRFRFSRILCSHLKCVSFNKDDATLIECDNPNRSFSNLIAEPTIRMLSVEHSDINDDECKARVNIRLRNFHGSSDFQYIGLLRMSDMNESMPESESYCRPVWAVHKGGGIVARVAMGRDRTEFFYDSQHCWSVGFTSARMQTVKHDDIESSKRRWKNGDLIEMVINRNKRTLEFIRNGQSLGIIFNSLPDCVAPLVNCFGRFTCEIEN